MKPTRIAVALLAVFCLTLGAFAQAPANAPNPGKYGVTGWAINNQRVASQYNYNVNSSFQSAIGGSFTFPSKICNQTLNFGANRNIGAFATNASVKIIDINSSLTETVNGVAPTYSGGYCTLSFSTANSHTSFYLRSGTCGAQEAINDLGTNGGEVIVDQRFYDDGCTQSTITGLNPLVTSTSGPIYGTTFIHDISNGQDTWYQIKPTTTTLISSGSAPTLTATTGGSLSNSTTYYVKYAYVDPVGGISLPSSEGSLSTGGSGTALTVTAPAAATGAVGYIPYYGSSSNGEVMAAPTTSICTLSTLESIIPACAMSSTAFFGSVPSSTALVQTEGTAHTTFAFQPLQGPPSTFVRASGTFQQQYLPFAQQATITTGGADIAEAYLPGSYFNFIGKSWDICFKVAATDGSSGGLNLVLLGANQLGQSPVTLATLVGAASSTNAITQDGCFTMVTAATGSSGNFWVSGAMTQTVNSSGASTAAGDVSTAVSSNLNLTQGIWISLQGKATTASATGVTVNLLSIRPTPGT